MDVEFVYEIDLSLLLINRRNVKELSKRKTYIINLQQSLFNERTRRITSNRNTYLEFRLTYYLKIYSSKIENYV